MYDVDVLLAKSTDGQHGDEVLLRMPSLEKIQVTIFDLGQREMVPSPWANVS